MSYILSNTTAAELYSTCRAHRLADGACDPECPIRCICGELVKDWPIQEATVSFDQNPCAGGPCNGNKT